ncbi:Hsp20/alpha crystallin family protein [Virgibacillus sp. NKC19-16]|uniref:Hsp20/alpha crystallin family protein n=1 Tax=Virgibacillus salidurans TaxID=2831673 RepID=UPI001F23CE1A|nr:Hsp20/alpha crystallin family protein [Virgibacillus sp. NKC19-16]UJL46681.1 Hsp20/alpha crystallin family protein [Virgibacillus sp. NKC19-16]
MSSNKYNNNSSFDGLMKGMDSFLNDSFRNFNSLFSRRSFDVDMYETKSDVVIQAKLPGIKRDQIELEIVGNQIRIAVQNTTIYEEINDREKHQHKEQSEQRMERFVTLPFTISEKETTAAYKDGVSKITTPINNASRKFIDIDK